MIDDDDVFEAAVLWPTTGGWVIALLGLIVVIALAVAAHNNRKECAAKSCAQGKAALMLGECLCVNPAK